MTTSPDPGNGDTRRKRLLFRAQRRGFREVDMVFGTFAAAELASLPAHELDQFEVLLDAADQDVWLWLQNKAPTPAEFDTPLFTRMKALLSRKNPTWNV